MSDKIPKKYKESSIDVIFTKDYFSEENDKGVSYPKNRITVSKVDYEGEYKDFDGNIKEYEGEKYRITNCKLENDNGVVVKSKKIITFANGNQKVYDDEKIVDLSKEHLNDILNNIEL